MRQNLRKQSRLVNAAGSYDVLEKQTSLRPLLTVCWPTTLVEPLRNSCRRLACRDLAHLAERTQVGARRRSPHVVEDSADLAHGHQSNDIQHRCSIRRHLDLARVLKMRFLVDQHVVHLGQVQPEPNIALCSAIKAQDRVLRASPNKADVVALELDRHILERCAVQHQSRRAYGDCCARQLESLEVDRKLCVKVYWRIERSEGRDRPGYVGVQADFKEAACGCAREYRVGLQNKLGAATCSIAIAITPFQYPNNDTCNRNKPSTQGDSALEISPPSVLRLSAGNSLSASPNSSRNAHRCPPLRRTCRRQDKLSSPRAA